MIKIKFPNSTANEAYDGKIHNTIPQDIFRLNNSNFFLLDFFDTTTANESSTVLHRTGNLIKNLPLLDFNQLNTMISRQQIKLTKDDTVNFFQGQNLTIDCLEPVANFQEYFTTMTTTKKNKLAITPQKIVDNKIEQQSK